MWRSRGVLQTFTSTTPQFQTLNTYIFCPIGKNDILSVKTLK